MSAPRRPLFLAPRPYRRRRLRDAARLLPIFGAVLLVLPVLWSPPGQGMRSLSGDVFYLFALWVILIAIAAAFARGLTGDEAEGDEEELAPISFDPTLREGKALASAGTGAAGAAGGRDADRAGTGAAGAAGAGRPDGTATGAAGSARGAAHAGAGVADDPGIIPADRVRVGAAGDAGAGREDRAGAAGAGAVTAETGGAVAPASSEVASNTDPAPVTAAPDVRPPAEGGAGR